MSFENLEQANEYQEKAEKEIYAMKKIAYRINKAIQFANGEEVEE